MESTNITHTSFEDTCRVCMTKNGALVDIFKCQNRNIPKEINYCSGVVINVSDNLPPNICVACLKQLSVACNFKQKCLKADEVFRQVLEVEQVEYLEDYFQVTEQEHGSIYVADIDKENTEIISSSNNVENTNNLCQDNNIENTKTKKKEEDGVENFEGRLENNKILEDVQIRVTTKINCGFKNNGHQNKNCKKKHLCELCGDQFGTHSAYLTHHMREHKSYKVPQYYCDVCGIITSNKYSLSTHMKKHSAKFKYTCDYCSQQFDSKNVLIRHISRHMHGEILQCSVCNIVFGNKSELEEHQKVHAVGRRIYACDKCPAKYFYITNYKCHMSVKHGGQSKGKKHVTATPKRNVKIDYEVINSRDDLMNTLIKEIHMENNTEEITDTAEDYINSDNLSGNEDSDFSLRYDESSDSKETTEQNGTLNTLHKRTNIKDVVRDDKKLKTKEITEQIGTSTMPREIRIKLQDALLRDKTQNKQEILKQNITSKTAQKRKNELQDVDKLISSFDVDKTKDMSFKCTPKLSQTKKNTEQISTLTTKQKRTKFEIQDVKNIEGRSKIKPKLFKCSKCDVIAKDAIEYEKHHQRYHEKPVTCCELCNKQYVSYYHYKVHMRLHETTPQYYCDLCNYNTVKKGYLRSHMVYKHLGGIKYTCDICPRQFSSQTNLKNHISLIHLNVEKCYSCSVCNRKFATKGYLSKHLKVHLLDRPSFRPAKHIPTVKITKIEKKTNDVPSKSTPKISNREPITEQTSILNIIQNRIKKEIQSVEINRTGDVPSKFTSMSRRAITEQTSTLTTVQKIKKNEITNVTKINTTEDIIPSKCTQKISNSTETTEQTSTLNTVQKRTKIEIKDVKNLESTLKIHKQRHVPSTVKPKVYKCSKCDMSFDDYNGALRHRRRVHGKSYTCEICYRQLRNRNSYRNHMRYMHDAKAFQYQCDLCDYKNARKGSLKSHMNVHTGGRPKVKRRITSEMATKMKCTCDYCKKDFSTKAGVYSHIISCHTKKDKHVCEICGELFSSLACLSQHKVSHGPLQYQCNVCAYKTARKPDLIKHSNIHSDNKYTCDHCKQNFNFKQNLTSHMRKMHLRNEEKNYKCTTCGRRYYYKYELDAHILGHLKIKSYLCEQCPSSFIKYPCYKYHMKKKHNVVLPNLAKGRRRRY